LPSVHVIAFVRASLPAPPARVLEIGAGDGELARALRAAGYDVLAIDPASETRDVLAVALADVEEPDESFDAAVAVLSLHHVEPLAASCERLAALVRPGGRLVVDEFAVERFDERAAGWWIEQRAALGLERSEEPAAIVDHHRRHLHALSDVVAELARHFALGEPVPGAYLHRWGLGDGLRAAEEELIAQGSLPATGARLLGTRLPVGFADMGLDAIGTVESPLTDRAAAPKQGDEGAPDAWLVFEPGVAPALDGIAAGDEILVFTWLDRSRRDVLRVHPRDDPDNPERGVFATRSSDRPNPIGLHRVTVAAVDGLRVRVRRLEALDGTPVIDVKPLLRRVDER